MHPYTEKQAKAFERGKHLLTTYKMISPEHADKVVNESVTAGDMIADILYTMTRCFQYPAGDVESVKIVALEAIEFDHTS